MKFRNDLLYWLGVSLFGMGFGAAFEFPGLLMMVGGALVYFQWSNITLSPAPEKDAP